MNALDSQEGKSEGGGRPSKGRGIVEESFLHVVTYVLALKMGQNLPQEEIFQAK